MPGKWIGRFQDTHPQDSLNARPLSQGEDPLSELTAGRARLVLLRFPEGESPAGPGLHVIQLYTEQPVIVAPKDHDAEYHDEDEVIPAEVASEWPRLNPDDYPPEVGGTGMLVEVLAAGGPAVAVLPQSLARLHTRKDVVTRLVDGEPATCIGLAWLRVDTSVAEGQQPLALQAADDPLVEEFIGVVRGRRAGSSRQPSVRAKEQAQKQARLKGKSLEAGARSAKGTGGSGKGSASKGAKNAGKNKESRHGERSGRRAAGPRGGSTGSRGRGRGRPGR